MSSYAYLNGEFLPLTEAKIPAMDRGFLLGDGVYEIIPVYSGKPFRLAQHLQRLQHSLTAIQLTIPLQEQELAKIFLELIKQNGSGDQSIYFQCTRGVVTERNHIFPEKTIPTLFAYTSPLVTKSIEEMAQGVNAITVPDIRWQRCDIKAITLLANVLSRQAAYEHNAQEAIFIYNDLAIEGCASNLFIVKNDVIMTPPLSKHILGGITRDLVLELAELNNLAYQEIDLPADQLLTADEIWLTSSSREIMPVINLNGQKVKDGQAGSVWYKMIKHYQSFKESFKKNFYE